MPKAQGETEPDSVETDLEGRPLALPLGGGAVVLDRTTLDALPRPWNLDDLIADLALTHGALGQLLHARHRQLVTAKDGNQHPEPPANLVRLPLALAEHHLHRIGDASLSNWIRHAELSTPWLIGTLSGS